MSRRKTTQTHRAALQQLSDQALDALLAIRHIVGTRRTWPRWAAAALGQAEPDARARTAFRRLLRRVYPRATSWPDHDALRTIAAALGVELPAAPKRTLPAPSPGVPRVRRRWPAQDPGPAPDGSPTTPQHDAGSTPASEPDAEAEARERERMERHNRRPEIWTPASSLSDAIHDEERGWW